MIVARPKEQRQQDQAKRGIGALRLLEDDLVKTWFEAEHTRLVEEMLRAEIADDPKRRDCALRIRCLSEMKSHLEAEAALGRQALKQLEKPNG